MNIVTSNAHFCQRVIKYSFKHGVTKTGTIAIKEYFMVGYLCSLL